MDARLQRRVQRYGWDLAADALRAAVAGPARAAHRPRCWRWPRWRRASACSTSPAAPGWWRSHAAQAVGPAGRVLGVDLSGRMVEAAAQRAPIAALGHAAFARMDAEQLGAARRQLRRGAVRARPDVHARSRRRRCARCGACCGRAAAWCSAVWGERSRCGWSPVFGIVDAEVRERGLPAVLPPGPARQRWRGCAPTRDSKRIEQRRIDVSWTTPTPTTPATRRSSAGRSRWRGRASTTARARACASAMSRPSRRGGMTAATACPASSSS